MPEAKPVKVKVRKGKRVSVGDGVKTEGQEFTVPSQADAEKLSASVEVVKSEATKKAKGPSENK